MHFSFSFQSILAALGLCCHAGFSLWGTGSRPRAQQPRRTGAPLVAASLVAELRLWTVGSAAAVQTWLPCGKQDPPRPGIEPHVPALAGGSPTTGAPDKSLEASTGRTRAWDAAWTPENHPAPAHPAALRRYMAWGGGITRRQAGSTPALPPDPRGAACTSALAQDAWGVAGQGQGLHCGPRATPPAHMLQVLPSPAKPSVEGREGH